MYDCCLQHVSKALVSFMLLLFDLVFISILESFLIKAETSICMYSSLIILQESGSSEAYITVFKPANPGTLDGPRIWNDQLLSYACYRDDDDGSKVIGDPKNVSYNCKCLLLISMIACNLMKK